MKLSKFIILLTSIFLISSCDNSNLKQVTKEKYLARAQEAEKNDPYYKNATIDFKYQIKTGNKKS